MPPHYSMVNAWPGRTFLKVDVQPRTCNCSEAPALKADRSSSFYEYTPTPWPSTASGDKDACDLTDSFDEASRALYLNSVIERSSLALNAMCDDYYEFRRQLAFLNPELADKYFGFTLGPDLKIKVTDPDEVLTPAELSYLTEKLNERETLKENLHQHTRTVMELVDHLPELFGAGYVVDLQNYHKIIDYGQIFTRNSIGNFMDTWAYQVERHAQRREATEEHRDHHVDVKA
ncbi:hypothetical protein [Pseudomonas sp. StFLB209]|uniref:hypothetical protein n=1 Tax=Pseudomonas sp. StFLB209 TaxID=1028989 RepID=UPI001185A34B|nr:hypothetical protein [Pseudomonas sp. StFLB209]